MRGEFPVGSKLPSIVQLHYAVAGLNTIRQAQTLLVNEGLLESQQGVGVFIISTTPQSAGAEQLLVEMRTTRTALDRAIVLLERTTNPMTADQHATAGLDPARAGRAALWPRVLAVAPR